MKYTLIYFNNKLYAAINDGIVTHLDPPEVYFCIEVKSNIIKDILTNQLVLIIQKSKCTEITDLNKIKLILTLYA